MRAPRVVAILPIVLIGVLCGLPLTAQFNLDDSPNLRRGWGLGTGQLGFLLEHRFEFLGGSGGLINLPTLVVAAGLPAGVTGGLGYTSQSEIVPEHLGGGETEMWLRRSFAPTARLRFTPQLARNGTARSWDGSVLVQWRTRPATFLGEGRLYSSLFGEEAAAGLAIGMAMPLTDHLAVVGDVGRILGSDAPASAWSAGFMLRIPGSPHTLGFHASNVGATTLQGVSRPAVVGVGRTRYGFTFTTPLTTARWREVVRRRDPASRAPADTGAATTVEIRDFAFQPVEIRVRPGEAVTWVNREPFEHTVTGQGWGSGLFEEGERFTHRFQDVGRYEYHCVPHPFMRAVVIVEEQPAESSLPTRAGPHSSDDTGRQPGHHP